MWAAAEAERLGVQGLHELCETASRKQNKHSHRAGPAGEAPLTTRMQMSLSQRNKKLGLLSQYLGGKGQEVSEFEDSVAYIIHPWPIQGDPV